MNIPDHIRDAIRKRNRDNARLYRSKNPERLRAYNRELRKKYPDRYKAYRKSYLDKRADTAVQLRKEDYIKNRDSILARNKRWYLRNRASVVRRQTERNRKRIATDPAFKCVKMLRNRIVEVLKRQDTVKFQRTKELIGCDRQFLRDWIEARFTDGMTWENHGSHGWHIDHIRPCASFDLTDREQQKECFHYSNLQPLWAKQNQSKGDRCNFRII